MIVTVHSVQTVQWHCDNNHYNFQCHNDHYDFHNVMIKNGIVAETALANCQSQRAQIDRS